MSMTPARLQEIAAKDPHAADACVAKAMGWEPPTGGEWKDDGKKSFLWHRDGVSYLAPGWDGQDDAPPPPYVSHAADAPDGDRLDGEMRRALRAEYPPSPLIITWWPSGTVTISIGSIRFDTVKASSLPLALGCALDAAGLLEEKE